MMMVVVVVKMVVIVMMVVVMMVVISVWPIAPQSEITDYRLFHVTIGQILIHNDVITSIGCVKVMSYSSIF